MDLGIAGKAALVTAGSKGLGRGSAEALAAEGVSVAICARGKEALEETADAIRDAGGTVLAIEADVNQPDAPAELVRQTVDAFGRLDILVANTGGPKPGRALDVDDESILGAVNDNLLTMVRLTRSSLPHMRANGWGRVCMIASASLRVPIPDLTLSNITRTGLLAWCKTAAQDVRDEGITVNLACPGMHLTERVKQLGHASPNFPMGDAGDFGKVVAFLCSEPAKFINGAALSVDGAGFNSLL